MISFGSNFVFNVLSEAINVCIIVESKPDAVVK